MSTYAPPLLLRNARALRSGTDRPEYADIAIDPMGRIQRIDRDLPAPAGTHIVDLQGRLVTPGLVDVHQHLDKTLTRATVPNPDGTLMGAINAFSHYARTATHADLMHRAERMLNACLVRGTVAIRTHANVDAELELRAVEALVELRERWRDRMHIQVVALVSAGIANGLSVSERLDRAVHAGVDLIGGAPAISADPRAFIDELFTAAERHGKPLDLHLDEHLDPKRQHFDLVIDRVHSLGMQSRVVLGHCCALSALPPDDATRLCERLARARIGVITLPAANLFLQGREASSLTPRGLTRVAELRAAGVAVACGSDNTQDPFVPSGSGDMLEMARWTLLAAHLDANQLHDAFAMASIIPAQFMTLDRYGLHEGARADLLITDADDAADLVASGPLQRAVLFGGKLVAGTL